MKVNTLSDFVFYDNTDCGGIMYHADYITVCERARSILFFRQDAFPCAHEFPANDGFVVKNIESHFLAPLKLGDYYEVRTQVCAIKNTSLILQHEIYRIKEIGSPAQAPLLTFRMSVVMVYVDRDKKPKRIPQRLRDIFSLLPAN
ncbi:acyl-CoA thioesterase [Helicobacter aurati]|uniref:Acyl-CoA thioesterase n=1 Tax=Helicobacter aurati TaxID=137778 RepID=A0A3D8J1H9_9HELI|nr:thioesterase family protein [Helicobacter aurati]RDU70631.1 acyl-CoA thioesterase [Helicobacter aurati]